MRNLMLECAFALGLAGMPVFGQCEYDLVVIPAPNCGFFGDPGSLRGVDINESGEIVGDIGCVAGRLAYRWSEAGGLEQLSLGVDANSSWATGINDAGVITGYYESNNGSLVSGFIFDSGRVETIAPPPGGNRLRPTGISESGTIFGHWGNNVTGPGLSAFIRNHGSLSKFEGIVDANLSEITDVNSADVFVGWLSQGGFLESRAFMLDKEGLTLLTLAPGGTSSDADAINASGTVVGATLFLDSTPITKTATIWQGDRLINISPFPGHQFCEAHDVNNLGQVVGRSREGVPPSSAFLWQNGRLHDLNDLLAVKTTTRVEGAWAINDRGMITGHASPGSGTVAFVMSPRRTSDADITIDCVVDTHDLVFLLERWGTPDQHADLNGDGTVGFADLVQLLAHWG